MKQVTVRDAALQQAAGEGMDEFIKVFTDAIYEAIGGELTQDNIGELSSDQVTLLAYVDLRDEVMDGGFVQLIHNGYGAFIFRNPFDKAVRQWGDDMHDERLRDLYRLIKKCRKLYDLYHEELEKDWTQEEFDALYERFPEFDDFDDAFVEHEEGFTDAVAHYVDEHIDHFAKIEK